MPTRFTVVAAIELDDSTHQGAKDAQRDSIFESARLPLVRLHVRNIPAVEELKALFTR
jgi:very-short-patch-repair endonuclease